MSSETKMEYQLKMTPILLLCQSLKYVGTRAEIGYAEANWAIEMAAEIYDAVKNGKPIPEPKTVKT